MDDSKTSAPGTAEPQLRNDCLSFWSVKAELGLRGPGGEGPVFLKIWYCRFDATFMLASLSGICL